ncbi:hypothetical protein [Sphingomonas hankookensis]|uniref:hypothetical protein n=1 Tax=Sphingomonas hankookensis TaxID=563996 RepID=UPI003D303264
MRATVAQRETVGLNVHFLREDGTPDRFSFATSERAEAFRAKLRRQGVTILEANG